jgi:hypothetical protein
MVLQSIDAVLPIVWTAVYQWTLPEQELYQFISEMAPEDQREAVTGPGI